MTGRVGIDQKTIHSRTDVTDGVEFSFGVQDRRVETRSFGNVPHIVGDLAVKKANTIFPYHVKDDARREGDAADGAGISGSCHF